MHFIIHAFYENKKARNIILPSISYMTSLCELAEKNDTPMQLDKTNRQNTVYRLYRHRINF